MQTNKQLGYGATGSTGASGELRRIDPLFNEVFIRVFGSERSYAVTKSLVNAILAKTDLGAIDDIEQLDAEHTLVDGGVGCKTPRIDVQIVASNRIVNMESQRQQDAIGDRSIFYASKLMTKHAPRGARYEDLPQIVVITLLDNVIALPGQKDFITVSKMVWQLDGQPVATDKVSFVLVELEKFRRRYNSLSDDVIEDETLAWLYLLTRGFGRKQEVEEMSEKFPTMIEFAELYGYALNDPKLERAYDDMISAEMEYNSQQSFYKRLEDAAIERGEKIGIERGLKQGIEQGIEQGIKQTIDKLRELGVDESLIAALQDESQTN